MSDVTPRTKVYLEYGLADTASAAEIVAILNAAAAGGTGTGSVTSVTFTGDGTVLSSTPTTPVTTTGTLAPALVSHVANTVLAGPSSGGSAAPTFRALVAADIPTLVSANIPTTGLTITQQAGVVISPSYSDTLTLDWSLGNKFLPDALGGNPTIVFSNMPALPVSQNMNLILTQGTGGQTVTWPTSIVWVSGSEPVLSTGAGKRDRFFFESFGTSSCFGYVVALNF